MHEEDPGCIICAGHVCLDVIPAFPVAAGAVDLARLLNPGSLTVIGPAEVAPGGPVSNVGIALCKLGVRTAFMGKVGNDLFGRGLLELFAPYGADRGMTVATDAVTSYTVVLAPPGVDRIFLHNPGANDTYCAADVDRDRIEDAAIFHLGYPPLMRRLYEDGGGELETIFKQAKTAGATTSLDLAFPDPASPAGRVAWRPLLERVLPHVDIFLPSCEELMFMLDRDRFRQLREKAVGKDPVLAYTGADIRFLAREALALGAGVVGLKVGLRGLYLATAPQERLDTFGRARPAPGFARRELWHGAFRAETVVSATGSGDSAIAGFLAAFLRGKPVETCLTVACAAGADNVTALDATSGVRSWEETVAGAASKVALDPAAGPAFSFCEPSALWAGTADGSGVTAQP